jgi:CheY-like chemotaxis protein
VHHLTRLVTAVALLILLASPATAQDPRNFFKPPETALEFWRAVQFEINVGKYDLAAAYLKGLLARNPTDEELLQIYDQDGASAFARLLTIPELREPAKPLIERVNAVVLKHLGDPRRLAKFIRNLNGSAEERAYAIGQLRRVGPMAMPQLIDALRNTMDDTAEHAAILSALTRLNRDIVPPLVAALDVENPVLRMELIDVLHKRGDTAAAPHLWYLAGSPKQSELVRKRATEVLAAFLDIPAAKLPPAKAALTKEAERYYLHQNRFINPDAVPVWRWDGMQLVSTTVPASRAEEYFGLRFARQALQLDPTYQPAQILFLSQALDKGFERGGLDQPLSEGAPAVKELLASANPELVTAVLDRALAEHRLPVILGAVRALGDQAEVRAARPTRQGAPALVQALNYPDRRVQMAAAEALLRIPGPPAPQAASRVVEVLRRAVAADALPRVLVADFSADRAQAIAAAVKQAGFEPVVVGTGRDVMRRLNQAADIDAVMLDSSLPDPGLLPLLAQLRADVYAGRLPVLILAPSEQVDSLQRLTERYRNVSVVPAANDAEFLKTALAERITQAMGKPLSEDERKAHTSEGLVALARLARGEVPGYDVRPAEDAVLRSVRNDELANVAIEIAGRLPGAAPQRDLATLLLDGARPAPLRSKAALELVRHIQQYGLALTPEQVRGLEALYETVEDPKLKANVALAIGGTRPSARETGLRLQRYNPPLEASAPPAPPIPTEGKKEPEEKKEAELPKEK